MSIKYRFLNLLSIVALCTSLACKTQLDNHSLPLDPELRTGKLANGFTYYIRKNKSPEKKVMMYLAVKVGSILESDRQQGVAHFVEHMSFNGIKHFPKKELANYLEKAGVRFGADLNANTGFDETVYQLPLPSDQPELLANGLQIMRDWAQDAVIDAEDVEKERHVILEEKRARQGMQQRYEEQSIPFCTNGSRYGLRLPIGKEEVLLKVTPEEIRSFYKDWYRPDLQALIVVGDIDVDQIEKAIKSKFADLKNPEKEQERPVYRAELTGKNQYMQFIDPEFGGIGIEIMMKQKQTVMATTLDYRSNLMKNLLGQMVNARFRQMNFATFNPIAGGLSAFSINLTTKPAEMQPSLQGLWLELRRMQEQGFLQTELDRVKKSYQQDMANVLKEQDKITSEVMIKPYLQHFLTGNIVPGIPKDYELTNQMLPDIGLKEINDLMKSYIKDTDRDIIVKSSEENKAFLPDEATVLDWISAVYTAPLSPFVDEVQHLPLLKKAPVPGKITAVEDLGKIGIQKITLSNGLTVLLKKTNFQNDQILFKGFAEGGASLYADADNQNAINAANIVSVSGAGNYDAHQLVKLMAGRPVQVSPFVNDTYQGFTGSSSKEELATTLELLNAYFTEPRKDAEAFHVLIGRTKEQLANKGNNPTQAFIDTVTLVLANYHVRKQPQSLSNIDAVKLDRAYEIYKERFADASGFTFFFVGNVDLETMKPLLEKYLGSLPSKGLKEKARDLNINIPAGRIAKKVYNGKVQKSSVMLVYSGPFDYSYNNVFKMNAIVDALKISITQRLRDQEGGTYTPNVQMTMTKYLKSRFSLTISFDCAPENVDKLIASAQDELNKMRKSGPSVENLQKYKAVSQSGLQTGSTNNGFWLDYLASRTINKEPLTQFFDYETAINNLTVQSIQQAAATYIHDENYVKLVLMPEKTKN